MLTKDGCKARRKRLWDSLRERVALAVDWIIIADPQHLMYFFNYYQSPFVFRSNDAGAIGLLSPDSGILIADNLLEPFCAKAYADEVITPVWYRGKESAPHREALLVKSTLERLKKCEAQAFGYEPSQLPAGITEGLRSERGNLRLVSVEPLLTELKRRKDKDELELLKRSMKAGEAGMAAGLREIQPGMTELDAYLLVQKAALREAGDQAIVYGDFVSGPRCEEIGGPPGDRKIQKGELVLLDFSTIVFQYRADFANTFACGGKPTDKQRDLYQACADAMKAGEKLLRAGAECKAIDRAVRGFLEAKHLGDNFPHHTGHGIGLGHPEAPFLVPESKEKLVAGDVVTIEPGQYVKGVGGMRYERNYLITDGGYELLSNHAIAIEA